MAAKLAEAMAASRLKQTEVAEACGVTKQAVQGWLRTGRIGKVHLPKLESLTGRPLAWWLDLGADAGSTGAQEKLVTALQDWRQLASSRSQEVIDQLTLLARRNALTDDDWKLVEQLVRRFATR